MPLIHIFVILLLVAANGFFVACEFSLVAVRPSRIHQLREGGDRRAKMVESLLSDLDRVLSGVQVGITMSSLALGWLGELTLARMFEPLLTSLGLPWGKALAHTIAITIAFLAITSLHVVLGELVPKSMALQRAETVALVIGRPMAVFMAGFRFFIDLFDNASSAILRGIGYRATTGHALVRSAEELRVLLQQVNKYGILGPRQARMLEGALELSDRQVREVMVPRHRLVMLPVTATLEQVLTTVRTQRRSRYPVFEGTPEQVMGSIHTKDLFRHVEERMRLLERGERPPGFDLRPFVRETLFVAETKPVAELLEDFRRRRIHLAVVVDEYGSVQGMVTLADLLEPIVGEVLDEYEQVPAPEMVSEGGLVLDARISLHDLEQQHQIELPPGPGFETLAGFVLNRLGGIPSGGESFLHDGLRFTVLEMAGRRVARVKIEKLQPANRTMAEASEAERAAAES
jgi:CBS domain containing-hemolysin-like protein